MKKTNIIMLLVAVLLAVSCGSDKNSLDQASTSPEYLEYKRLIDQNKANVTSNNLEHINIEDWNTHKSFDELADAGILSRESVTYKHYKAYERISELNDILVDKYGMKGHEISLKLNRFRDKSYYQELYKNRKNENREK